MPRARSTSLNPVIYPDWWGHEDDGQAMYGRKRVPKRLKSADPARAKVYRAINRHAEDTLDKRLRNVYDGKENYYVKEDGYYSSGKAQRHMMQDSYAYTRPTNVSPIRPARPGDSNIPMSYKGPPNEAEMRRNQGRHRQNQHSKLQE